MIPHFALAFAAVTLIADPLPLGIGQAPPLVGPAPTTPGRSDAAQMAITFGFLIGAASECSLDGDRVASARAKAQDLIDNAAQDGMEDSVDLDDRFQDSMADGREGVLDGTTECSDTTAQLRKLETGQGDN
jgi:hypothetical protein